MKTHQPHQAISESKRDSTKTKTAVSPNNDLGHNTVIKPSVSKQKRTKQTQFNPSNTGVYPKRTHGVGLWGNSRVVMSIRVDEKLKKEATRVLKLIFGSTCRGIEAYLAGLVATYHSQGVNGVYPSNTIDIKIDNLNVQRNLKTRRRLVVEEETVETVRPKPEEKTFNYVDYSKLPLKQLQNLYDSAKKRADVVKTQLLAFELKRRGCIR